MNTKEAVTNALSEIRVNEGVSQQKLAEYGGVSVRYCHDLEYGISNVSFKIMANFHNSCGLDLNKLAEQIVEED